MKHLIQTLGAALVAATLAAPAATAGTLVGVAGTTPGVYDTYADLWTNITDTGVSTNFVPGTLVGGSSGGPAYITEFRTQALVGTMSNSALSALVTPPDLNHSFELSKVVRFQERIDFQTADTVHFTLPTSQDASMDVDPGHGGVQNFAIYFDRLSPASPAASSRAIQGNGPGTVRCYGAGVSSAGCGGVGDTDGDGVLAMSGHLIFNDASFVANGSTGTGSSDARFMIDFVHPDFFDVPVGAIFIDKVTSTMNVPSFFTPALMWDGTSSSTLPYFKVDSSQSFIQAVPEPASATMLGLGMAVLALAGLRRARS
ncbi:PEP-CTERM sorting domain-containing protein [Oxalobacteraceae bacterium]|nr:PEP-CTERM sorting domain-containing protein [Oxalobacteraceae bacterium]